MNKKIAFIASYPQSLLNFRLALMQSFIARGYTVIALAPEDKEVAATLKSLHIQYIPIPMQRNGLNPFTDLLLIVKLWRTLRAEKPQLLFTYTIKPVIYGSLAGKLAGVPYIYALITGTGYVFMDNDMKGRLVGFISSQLFRIALYFNKLIFFQNKDNLTFFKDKKIISQSKPATVVNGSGVDCQIFTPTDYPATISFLLIARFLPQKGIYEYVEAARRIKQNYPTVCFRLVGWIDTNPNSITQKELDTWIESGCIEYLGKLEDVRPALADTSVYVLPSYHEGTPRTVLEAMAMARPVITADAPGCRETVIHNKNGFLVPMKNSDAIYQAMEYFILAPEQIPLMGQASRQLALEKYDVHKVNQSILQAMQLSPATQ